MALYMKDFKTPYGVKATYWKIAKLNLDLHYKYCDIVVHGFYDEEARLEGMEPLEIKTVRANWNPSEFDSYFAPQTFTSANIVKISEKEDKSIKPYLGELKAEDIEVNKEENIYERAYAYLKAHEMFSTCTNVD
jgi:hypothetical protein